MHLQLLVLPILILLSLLVAFHHRGFTNTYHHTALLSIDNVNDKAGSNFYMGKRVAYIYKAQKSVSGSKFRVVWGKVMRAHGTNGAVRAKFTTNIPVSIFHVLQSMLVFYWSLLLIRTVRCPTFTHFSCRSLLPIRTVHRHRIQC